MEPTPTDPTTRAAAAVDPSPRRPSRRRFGAAAGAALAAGGLAACQTPSVLRSAAAAAGPSDWLEAVRADHRAVDAAFERLLATNDPAARAQGREALADLLSRHALQEENALYPALAMAGVQADAQQLYADHAQEEETRIYPAFRSRLTPEQNAAVGARYRAEGAKYRAG